MKICSVLLLTALASSAVPAFSQAMTVPKASYQPGESIQMTVKFDSAVEPGSSVVVVYHHEGPVPSDEATHVPRLNFRSSSSSDNKTFVLQAKVDDTCASGEYIFGGLEITKGDRSGGSSTVSNPPEITIKNPEKDPKPITVPPFSIQVK